MALRRYDPVIDILVLCTANQCRSPMAEALLRRRLTDLGVDATVSSAGELRGGAPASAGSVRAMAARGLDLRSHVSRTVSAADLEAADLVLTMARSHLRNAVALVPSAFPRTFTLRELARRGGAIGRRRAGQSLDDWLALVHGGRTTLDLIGDDPADDIADPMGRAAEAYDVASDEIARLIDVVLDLVVSPTEQRETA